MVEVGVKIPALEKLLEVVKSGIGSIAGPALAPWTARKESEAKVIQAEGKAKVLNIEAQAQVKARNLLMSDTDALNGEIELSQGIRQRIEFQERKRQENIESIVHQAALELEDLRVPVTKTDHDWTARFFREAQDVSSEEMQAYWSRVLAGEIRESGTTSIRTLGILKDIDTATAQLFTRFCSLAIYLKSHDGKIYDCRVPSLAGNAAQNSLLNYGLSFDALNRLNEYGLIISDYDSYFPYQIIEGLDKVSILKLYHQGICWDWIIKQENIKSKTIKLSGVKTTVAGCELSRVVFQDVVTKYTEALRKHLRRNYQISMRRSNPNIARNPEGLQSNI